MLQVFSVNSSQYSLCRAVAKVQAPVSETLQWILVGYGGLLIVGALLRFMLLNALVPAALAALLGFSIIDSADDAGGS